METPDLHKFFCEAVERHIAWHSCLETKPLEVDLLAPLPPRVRLYMYTITHPPGGRSLLEHKIQIMVPGQGRGDVGHFDTSGERLVLLAGYEPDTKVFVMWDAGMYPRFTFSRNVQVKGQTIFSAMVNNLSYQTRRLRGQGIETVIAARGDYLATAISRRADLSAIRLLGDYDG